jgi:hypothetical protein
LLFAGHNDIDAVPTSKTMIGDRKVFVRKVDSHDIGLLVDDMIDEAGVVMAGAV